MSIWFTADLHLGHVNIIGLCSRPFATTPEMDVEIIRRWNAVVQPTDTVWVVGDFACRASRAPQDYLAEMSGIKHLLLGNHDHENTRTAPGWASVQQLAEIVVESQRIVLCHYGLRVWPKSHRGALHIYGHSHGRLPGDRQSLDVGVDCWDFRPVSLQEIQRRLATLPPRGFQVKSPG
ncbi:metallophosphoesterase [Lichenicola sp.]|uniref:metallophosphoesterase n=1 Tax=Lichenicola sp. TaxID=2804529 RepID=UPI003B006CBC